ncbi:hypothetical protein OYC64_001038 [Pagothenia borchgrevinki]|uniref:Uncharacterized protein n=1 Tax=Pagothenia borchgrevinki TaxID=8213 RepID=A0ABD2HG29_PAGBO
MANHAVFLKMAEFWEASAAACFAQAEAQSALREIIGDDAHYFHCRLGTGKLHGGLDCVLYYFSPCSR